MSADRRCCPLVRLHTALPLTEGFPKAATALLDETAAGRAVIKEACRAQRAMALAAKQLPGRILTLFIVLLSDVVWLFPVLPLVFVFFLWPGRCRSKKYPGRVCSTKDNGRSSTRFSVAIRKSLDTLS